jgi:hypothetical protein
MEARYVDSPPVLGIFVMEVLAHHSLRTLESPFCFNFLQISARPTPGSNSLDNESNRAGLTVSSRAASPESLTSNEPRR